MQTEDRVLASTDAPDRQKVSGDAAEPQLYCPTCDARLIARKCKLICERCGYYMSCSDYV